MARIILKCPYLKPGSKAHSRNLIIYIATRDGVDKIDDSWKLASATLRQKSLILDLLRDFPDAKSSYEYQDYLRKQTMANASEFISRTLEDNYDRIDTRDNYVRYIANRPGVERIGTHGLFTDSNAHIDLQKVADEVAQHKGRIWTNVLSIRREDAQRLGYEDGTVWRDMIRGQAGKIAESMKIPLEDLRWYASFHNESHHPHVHLIVYSAGKEPYLTRQGIQNMKSSFAREIFKQDLLPLYADQTHYRNTLSQESRAYIQQLAESIYQGTYENTEVCQLLQQLSAQLRKAKGKKVYGYLPAETKDLVNRIVDTLAQDSRLAELYGLWYQQRDAIISTYQDTMEERLPLSQNKTFHSIRNIVIAEVLSLSEDASIVDLREEVPEEMVEQHSNKVQEKDSHAAEPPLSPTLSDNEPMDEVSMEDRIPKLTPTDAPPQYTSESYSFGKSKSRSWWTEEYKLARQYLYGAKGASPNPAEAFHLLLAQANTGNGLAMHDLGRLYLSGLGCDKDEAIAHSWFQKAHASFCRKASSEQNPAYWQYRIGKLYSLGYGVEQDYSLAADWFSKAVNNGSPFAAYALGSQYNRGQGVTQDFHEAFRLFTIAATDKSRPNAYAQYQLGRMCHDGIGTAVDRISSEKWYQEAYQGFLQLEQNMPDDKLYYRLGSMNLSGIGTDVDLLKAKEYLEKAAVLGNMDAHYALGKLYLREDFYDCNPAQAVWHLELAAQKDNTSAQYLLGKLLLQGTHIPQDSGKAVYWLEKSAALGNAQAQYLLGKALLLGTAVAADPQRGAILLERARAQGNLYASYTLGKAYLSGEQLPMNLSKAIHLLTDAAEQGLDTAQYALAKLYLNDALIPKDMEKALCWLQKAVERNNPFAQYQLGKMLLYGQDVSQDIAAGKALLQASADQGNPYAQRILATYGQTAANRAGLRLLSAIAQLFQDDLENEQSQSRRIRIDRKEFLKIAEKKQAQGLRLG